LIHHQYQDALSLLIPLYQEKPNEPAILRLLGACYYHLSKYDLTIEIAREWLKIRPNCGLAHHYMAQSIIKLRDMHNVLIKEFRESFSKTSFQKSYPYLDQVFINFNLCSDELQKVLLLGLFPFKHFLKVLADSGATVYLMSFHQLLWHCPYLQKYRGLRSIDLRLADDLGGQGGYHTTCDANQEMDVICGRYNVAFHEIGHLIHSILNDEQKQKLKQLFTSAKKKGFTLDWYADQNVREYFAQGIEAYLSERKLPGQNDTHQHTVHELKEKDPLLFEFIHALTTLQPNLSHEIEGILLKVNESKKLSDRISILENALQIHPNHPKLIRRLGDVYYEIEDHKKCLEIHAEALKLNNESVDLKIACAIDLLDIEGKVDQAVDFLLQDYDTFSNHEEFMHTLSYILIEKCDYSKALIILKKLLRQFPYPDPYGITIPDPFYLSGSCYSHLDKPQKAIMMFQKSIKLNGTSLPSVVALAFAFLKIKDFKQCQNTVKLIQQIDPNHESIEFLLKRCQ